jgi:hypothetical protein
MKLKKYVQSTSEQEQVKIRRPAGSGVPRNFFRGGEGFNKLSGGQRTENGDLGAGAPQVRGSGGSCNLVQEISLHIVNFS